MAVYFNEVESKLEKKSKNLKGFTYDDESQGGCINKFEEVKDIMSNIYKDIDNLSTKYNQLMIKYNKFTFFNDTMKSNINKLNSSCDNIQKEFKNLLDNLKTQVQKLEVNDSNLITQLEDINKLISSVNNIKNDANKNRQNSPKEQNNRATYNDKDKNNNWNGPVLSEENDSITGPSGKETYYNLDMSGIVKNSQPGGWIYNDAKNHGNEGNLSNDIWVRDDGCKMMGDYIMVAADLNVHPRGSLVETSLGTGVVVDTGTFAAENHQQLDIATTWKK